MKKVLSISIILCFYFQLYSQFKDGYIIKNSNDTTFGLINNEGSLVNSHSCQFKKDLNSAVQIYTPSDIKAFRFIDSKYYVSKIININGKEEKVFLEWLIKAKASILGYPTTSNGMHYYLTFTGDSLIELKNTKDTAIDKETDKKYAHEKKEYIGLLNYYLNGVGMQSEIMRTELNPSSLIKIAKDYQYKACKNNDCEVFEDKHSGLNFQLGISLSSYNSTLNISNDDFGTKVQLAKTVGIGLLMNFSNLPYLSPNFSIQIGVSHYVVLYKYMDTNFGYVTDDGGKLVNINLFRIPIQMEYKFQTKILQPYIGLGVVDNIRTSSTIYNVAYQDLAQTTQNFIGLQQFGLLSVVGVNYNVIRKLSLKFDFTFEYASAFFNNFPSADNINYIVQLGLLYKIK